MTLALATRGYLCQAPTSTTGVFGPGPGIVSTEVLKPMIVEAVKKEIRRPCGPCGGGSR